MTTRSKFIPEPLYKKIIEVMPIPCVDAIIVHKGKFLLGQRINKPLRDEWCFVGGRVRKGELLKDAVHRHVQPASVK